MRRLLAVALGLLLIEPVGAQTIPSKGTASTFEVATWNIEWFGSTSNGPSDDERQLQQVAAVIRGADIDLWAVQEIDDENQFRELLDELGTGWRGELSSRGTNFKVGYIYNTDVIFVRKIASVLEEFSDDFAGRPPLQIEADVMLPADTLRTTFITLHMKAFGDRESYEKRDRAALRLKIHIDHKLENMPVVILGDFNDELGASITSGRESPYAEFVGDSANYAFLTLPLDQEDVATWCARSSCTTGSTFDHILITDELFEAYEEGSANRYDELLDAIDRYTSTTSDHLPVFAQFQFAQDTGAERLPDLHFRVGGIYPNPARGKAHIAYETSAPGRVSIHLADLLGRTRSVVEDRFESAGSHTIDIETDDLPTGTYLIRLQAGGRSAVKPFVVVR